MGKSEKYVIANRGEKAKIGKNLTNRPKTRTIFFGWKSGGEICHNMRVESPVLQHISVEVSIKLVADLR